MSSFFVFFINLNQTDNLKFKGPVSPIAEQISIKYVTDSPVQ